MKNLPNQFYYSEKEDRLNVISHGTGFVLSIIGLVFLINKGLQDFDITRFSSFIIYGMSLSTMYIASTLYHNSKTPKSRYNFRLFDMISIYLLIAGSYTPFTLTVLIDDGGLILFALVWLIAFFGIIKSADYSGSIAFIDLTMDSASIAVSYTHLTLPTNREV